MEEWKEVQGFSKYEVSNTGKIREKESSREIPQPLNNNYLCVNMYRDDGVKVLCKVHRIVALAFIPNTDNVHNVDHKGDRLDNSVDNLHWRPKKVKEVKPEKTLTFLDKAYTYEEFCAEAGCEISTLKERLKASWTIRECYTGIKAPRNGYEDGSYWYPSKMAYKEYVANKKVYTYEEFCAEAGCETSTLKERLKASWTIRECYTGIKAPRNGYEDGSYWYPSKMAYKEYVANKKVSDSLKRKEQSERERLEGVEQRKQNRLDYRKFGVGNFVNYPIPGIIGRKQLKVYRVWSGILSRCYSPKNQSYSRYGARGVYVCDGWLEFQNFAAWYYEQPKGEDWHIDKDIISEGNLIYSPDTCTFVPPSINTFFATLPKNIGFVPTLTFDKGGYKASISDGEYKYSKTFKTQYEGFIFYKKFKEDRARELAKEFNTTLDARVVEALLNFTVTLPLES